MTAPRFEFHMERNPSEQLLDSGPWVEVSGGGIEGSVLIRLGKDRAGRPIVTGLIIGEFERDEITADTLRSIRIRPILNQLFEDFDPNNPPSWEDDLGAQVEWGLMHETVWTPAEVGTQRTAAARGPSMEDLRRFAEIYRREFVRNPRRAMTATAEAFGGISRATANRWADVCRENDLLPPRKPD